MATNGLVTPVVDGSGFHNRFGGAEDVLDCPECFVDVSDRLGVVEAISAHHPEPVVACFGFDLLLINREMIVTLNFQVATVTFVTHQTLVPLSKLLLAGSLALLRSGTLSNHGFSLPSTDRLTSFWRRIRTPIM